MSLSTLVPSAKNSGSMTEPMKNSDSTGTPRKNSIKVTETDRINGMSERRPSAQRKLNGKATTMLAVAIKTFKLKPPQRSVLTISKPNRRPSKRAMPTTGRSNQAAIDVFKRIDFGKVKEPVITKTSNAMVRLMRQTSSGG